MACVRMDMSDPTARNLCFTCGASWVSDVERCRDCGSALLAREQIEKEFEGSAPAESLPEFSSLELLCAATGEAEQRRVRERLEEYDVPYFCFRDDQGRGEDGSSVVTTNFYIADLQLDWARANLTDLPGGGRSVLLIREGNDLEAAAYRGLPEDLPATAGRLRPVFDKLKSSRETFMAKESDVSLSGEIEEHDTLRCSIPGLRFLRATAVPRWAVEEPEEGVEQDDEQGDEQLAEHVPAAPARREQDVPRIIPYHRYFGAVVDDEELPEEGDVDSTSMRTVKESTYNEQGLLTLREAFESDALVLRKRFVYSANGTLLRKVVEDPVNETLETEERTYGANNKIARKVITYSDGSRLTTEHQWNGDREEEVTSSEEGIESRVIRTYDSKDRLIERVEIDPQSKETRRVLNTYDAQDRFVESRVIESDGSHWVSARTEYNADGNEKSIVSLDANGNEIQRTVCAYEGGDRVQEVTTNADGETRTENVFDDAHHCIRSTMTGIGVAKDYIFEYDERGLQTAMAFRSMEDRGLGGRRRIEARVGTIWREYEFYSSAEATSI